VGFKLNGTHQFPVYADDVNISGRSILTREKNREALLVNSKETGLEVYTEKIKDMVGHVCWTECRTKSQHKHRLQILLVGGTVQILGNESIKSKLPAWIN